MIKNKAVRLRNYIHSWLFIEAPFWASEAESALEKCLKADPFSCSTPGWASSSGKISPSLSLSSSPSSSPSSS